MNDRAVAYVAPTSPRCSSSQTRALGLEHCWWTSSQKPTEEKNQYERFFVGFLENLSNGEPNKEKIIHIMYMELKEAPAWPSSPKESLQLLIHARSIFTNPDIMQEWERVIQVFFLGFPETVKTCTLRIQAIHN